MVFEKLEDDSKWSAIYYNFEIDSWKSFECDGIMPRKNYDKGIYNFI
jgi:hypothetical protein